ncbi:hypothetical protein [Ferruginibacter sp.]
MQFGNYAAPGINRQMNSAENKADELFNVLPEIHTANSSVSTTV